MLDPVLVRADPEAVRASQLLRGEDPGLVDELLAADEAWRRATSESDDARRRLKDASKQTGALRGDPEAQEAARAAALEVKAEVEYLDGLRDRLERERDAAARRVPNVVLPGVPAGGEEDFRLLATKGPLPDFGFPVRDHVELATGLGILDLDRGARTSGTRFYYLLGDGARLERALAALAHDLAEAAGFEPVAAPVLVRREAMDGTGFLGAHAAEVYRLEADDLYLVGTSEVPLAALHASEVLTGPRRYVATTSCFRREAGSHGRDTRGIFRVHQFQKTEMFVFCPLKDAALEHERLVALERSLLDALELPYRVIDVAAGDLGSSAARKVDIEVWVPSQGRYREVTSSSNCTTFQARRLRVRHKSEDGRVQVMATLNGTLAASTRLIVAILENHQQEDGSVRVPEALRPYMGGRSSIA